MFFEKVKVPFISPGILHGGKELSIELEDKKRERKKGKTWKNMSLMKPG